MPYRALNEHVRVLRCVTLVTLLCRPNCVNRTAFKKWLTNTRPCLRVFVRILYFCATQFQNIFSQRAALKPYRNLVTSAQNDCTIARRTCAAHSVDDFSTKQSWSHLRAVD